MAFKKRDVEELLVETGRRCCICRRLHHVQIHHIVPREKGGLDEVDNGIPLCPNCHNAVHREHSTGTVTRIYSEAELRSHRTATIEWVNSIESIGLDLEVLATYEEFPIRRVANALAGANSRLLVWHTWTQYFNVFLFPQLKQFLRSCWEAGPMEDCTCKILLAHPGESECAKLIGDFERALRAASSSVGKDTYEDLLSIIEVRLYSSVLAMPTYIVDDRAFVGWYPEREKSHFAPYLEFDAERGTVIRKLESWFIAAWEDSQWAWDFRSSCPVPTSSARTDRAASPSL